MLAGLHTDVIIMSFFYRRMFLTMLSVSLLSFPVYISHVLARMYSRLPSFSFLYVRASEVVVYVLSAYSRQASNHVVS